MLKVCVLFFITTLHLNLLAQKRFVPDSAYKKEALEADAFYKVEKYLPSALAYDTLFQKTKGQGFATDKYNAACSWALASNKNRAFQYLNEISATNEIRIYDHLVADSDLITLHTDKRWPAILKAFKLTEENAEKKLNKPLMAMLDTIFKIDQEYRVAIQKIRRPLDTQQSDKFDSLARQMNYYDSINLTKVKSIIDNYGWLGYDEIGDQGNLTLFLVIQHSDSATQTAYLPKMKEAFKNGKARGSHLALLEDRVLVRQGKKQTYGSQVRTNAATGKFEFYPIENEKYVNLRRIAVDLEPLEEYAKRFQIDYVLPQN